MLLFSNCRAPALLKYQWIRPLHWDIATELPEDKIFIGIHHFREVDIIRADRTVQADGFRPTYGINKVTATWKKLFLNSSLMRTSYFSRLPVLFIYTVQKTKRFIRQPKEEDSLAKCLHDTKTNPSAGII